MSDILATIGGRWGDFDGLLSVEDSLSERQCFWFPLKRFIGKSIYLEVLLNASYEAI